MKDHPAYTPLTLEQFLLEELPPDRTRALAAALVEDPDLQARVRALREHDRAFLQAHPAGRMVPLLLQRAGEVDGAPPSPAGRRLGWRMATAVAGIAAVCLLALFVVGRRAVDTVDGPILRDTTGGPMIGADRIKGDEGLFIYMNQNGKTVQLADGDRVAEGDVLELRYPSSARHGVVVSIDGRGTVTLHFPAREDDDTSLSVGRLNRAYMLDDAPGFERFLFVTSAKPIPVGAIVATVRRSTNPARRARFFADHPGISDEYSVVLYK